MMQLITRCPQCETAFAFESSQLRLAQGWVRCGQCSSLFEADKYLFERGAGIKGENAQEPRGDDSLIGSSGEPSPTNTTKLGELKSDLKALKGILGTSPQERIDPAPFIDEGNESIEPGDLPLGYSLDLSPGLEKMKSLSLEIQNFSGVQPVESFQHKEVQVPVDGEIQLQELPNSSTGLLSSKVFSRLKVFLITVLILLSIGQTLWYKKEVLGAFSAQTHLFVQSICSVMGVDLGWPIEPQSLRIESSSFKLIEDTNYKVKLRLKNRQDYAVKTPWIELTLLAADEHVLVRKVFSSRSLETQEAIAPDKDLVIPFNITLDPQIAPLVVGYHLDFFYP